MAARHRVAAVSLAFAVLAAAPSARAELDALGRAEAALMDGDPATAESLAISAARYDSQAWRVVAEAREMQGDLAGAASAYAKAAAGLTGPAAVWATRQAQAMDTQAKAADAAKTAQAAQVKADAEAKLAADADADAKAKADADAKLAADAQAKRLANEATAKLAADAAAKRQADAAAQLAAAQPTPAPMPAPTVVDADLEAQRQALVKEREALAKERADLEAVKAGASPKGRPGQGFVVTLGGGVYNMKVADSLQQANSGGGSNNGSHDNGDGISPAEGAGIRWHGVVLAATHVSAYIDHGGGGNNGGSGPGPGPGNNQQSSGSSVEVILATLGYDWAFLHLGSVELSLPLHLDYAMVDVQGGNGVSLHDSHPGASTGLGLRWWITDSFSFELTGLVHASTGAKMEGLNSGASDLSMSHEGLEARAGLGWRIF